MEGTSGGEKRVFKRARRGGRRWNGLHLISWLSTSQAELCFLFSRAQKESSVNRTLMDDLLLSLKKTFKDT